jgi:hypothetical protein
MTRSRRRLELFSVVAFCVLLAGTMFALGKVPGLGRVKVTVRNVDPQQTLRAVTVHVTGASYRIGDVLPGKSASVRVNARGESAVTINFVRPDGNLAAANVDCYLESGYRGSIRADLDATGLVDSHVRTGL